MLLLGAEKRARNPRIEEYFATLKGLCFVKITFPTVPSSEDSCEDMSSGEESLSSSPPSDLEGTFFFELKPKPKWQTLSCQS